MAETSDFNFVNYPNNGDDLCETSDPFESMIYYKFDSYKSPCILLALEHKIHYLQEESFSECQQRLPYPQAASSNVTSISPHTICRTLHTTNPKDTISKANGYSSYEKRHRRKPEEIERHYICNWMGCDKAYGRLNNLNCHVRNSRHGPKREPKGMTDLCV